jgi:hypothetical protein
MGARRKRLIDTRYAERARQHFCAGDRQLAQAAGERGVDIHPFFL